jgi:uncharacterized phiE125 gp8 family phage protein
MYQPSRIVSRATEAEPFISLDDVKAHLRIEHDADDNLLVDLQDAAVSFFEFETRTIIQPSMLRTSFDAWPAGLLHLPRPPLRFVDSIRYIDPQGQTQTLPPSAYVADTEARPGRVQFTGTLPPLADRPGAITIDYAAGYGLTVAGETTTPPDLLLQGIKLLIGSWYENRADTSDRRVNSTPIAVDRIAQQFRFMGVGT